MRAVGFLMMAHMIEPGGAARAGRHDGGLRRRQRLRRRLRRRDGARRACGRGSRRCEEALERGTAVGFHAHNNLALAIGNCARRGRGGRDAGRRLHLRASAPAPATRQTEVLAAVLAKARATRPASTCGAAWTSPRTSSRRIMPRPQHHRHGLRSSLGYAGVYSRSCCTPSGRRSGSGLTPADILMELGRRKAVGGQEDLILVVAQDLAAERSGK